MPQHTSETANFLQAMKQQQQQQTGPGSSTADASSIVSEPSFVSEPPARLMATALHLLKPNGSILGRDVAAVLLPRFANFLQALPAESTKPALRSIDGRSSMSHADIYQFLLTMERVLHGFQIGRGHRCAVVLPNGPELALAILLISTFATCVPLNAFGAPVELEADCQAAACDVVIGLSSDPSIRNMADKLGTPFLELVPDKHVAGRFTLSATNNNSNPLTIGLPRRWQTHPPPAHALQQDRFTANGHADEVLILFTSGTTGSKKLVPHLCADILVATACIGISWKLTAADTNCNLMPLFHVGGIIRQVYSPIYSGGAVICCPSFDPLLFWQLLQRSEFTWYYAAPTMHQIILQTGRSEGYISSAANKSSSDKSMHLRMIANAAGGLLPSLARELRQVFRANVLPSYGMTECMPITSPPASYQLEKPGTSGVAVGPEIAILSLDNMQPMEEGKEGPICVRGESSQNSALCVSIRNADRNLTNCIHLLAIYKGEPCFRG